MRKTNLTGLKFGKLTVKGPAGKDVHQNQIWRCECNCGGPERIVEMKGYELRQREYPECPVCTKERAKAPRDKKHVMTRLNLLDRYIRGTLGKTSRCKPS